MVIVIVALSGAAVGRTNGELSAIMCWTTPFLAGGILLLAWYEEFHRRKKMLYLIQDTLDAQSP
jgi:hypothetical protein